MVDKISEEKIAEILKKLESFGTRHVLSTQDNPTRGVGAARKWIFEQFKSYSPRLEVSFDQHHVKGSARAPQEYELYNVVAVLPGTVNKDQQILISAHYDTVAFAGGQGGRGGRGQNTSGAAGGAAGDGGGRAGGGRAGGDNPPAGPGEQRPARDPNADAPGVTDDGSGTAAVMEIARVLSQYEFEKTLVFVAFAGEEIGLIGSRLYAEQAKKANQKIEAVLNNDIIGSVLSGNGRMSNSRLNVFSEDPNDSSSRQLARYIKEMGERYVPSMKVELVFRHDRFGRGGDHTPFNEQGFAAVRFSTPEENYAHQHSLTDTFANTSPPYIARVTKINLATAASLALSPKAPAVFETVERQGRKVTNLMLTRGRSRYDAALRWKNESPETDLAGYVVVMRSTLSPFWEKEFFVGNVAEFTFADVNIDEVVFGVKAVDKDGNESIVTAYYQPPRRRGTMAEEPPPPARPTGQQ
jgi:hypothetical protein